MLIAAVPDTSFDDGRTSARFGVVGRQEVGGDPLDQAAERNEFAERHSTQLVVATRIRAIGVDRHRRIQEETLVAECLDDASNDRRVEFLREFDKFVIDGGIFDGTVGVHHVLGPQHEVDGAFDIWLASRWRSNTARELVLAARVFCGPPPCTIAISIVSMAWPWGATMVTSVANTRTPTPTAVSRQLRWAAALSATPPTPTSATIVKRTEDASLSGPGARLTG